MGDEAVARHGDVEAGSGFAPGLFAPGATFSQAAAPQNSRSPARTRIPRTHASTRARDPQPASWRNNLSSSARRPATDTSSWKTRPARVGAARGREAAGRGGALRALGRCVTWIDVTRTVRCTRGTRGAGPPGPVAKCGKPSAACQRRTGRSPPSSPTRGQLPPLSTRRRQVGTDEEGREGDQGGPEGGTGRHEEQQARGLEALPVWTIALLHNSF